MRVVVPHTRLDDRTRALLDQHAPGWVGVPLDPGQPTAYQQLLAAEWADTSTDLVVVEHDIGIHASVLPGLDACPEPWCGHPYNIAGRLLVCLGCTRFRASLKAAVPDLFNRIDSLPYDGVPAGDWRRLDVRIADTLQSLGHASHPHWPRVEHYHHYPEQTGEPAW